MVTTLTVGLPVKGGIVAVSSVSLIQVVTRLLPLMVTTEFSLMKSPSTLNTTCSRPGFKVESAKTSWVIFGFGKANVFMALSTCTNPLPLILSNVPAAPPKVDMLNSDLTSCGFNTWLENFFLPSINNATNPARCGAAADVP